MLIVRDEATVGSISDPDLRSLLQQRIADMCDGEPFDPDLHGLLVIVESGDTADEIEAASGCRVLHNLFDDANFCDPGFSPSFEVLEEHPCCYEMVFVPGDGDFGIVIFIPKAEGVTPLFLAFCAQYATPAPEDA